MGEQVNIVISLQMLGMLCPTTPLLPDTGREELVNIVSTEHTLT